MATAQVTSPSIIQLAGLHEMKQLREGEVSVQHCGVVPSRLTGSGRGDTAELFILRVQIRRAARGV
jgi:hypothetical protein